MTLEERVTRLEQRVDSLQRVEESLSGLRTDFNAFRAEQANILGRILATLKALATRARLIIDSGSIVAEQYELEPPTESVALPDLIVEEGDDGVKRLVDR
jgi:hypothetical protein